MNICDRGAKSSRNKRAYLEDAKCLVCGLKMDKNNRDILSNLKLVLHKLNSY